MHEFISHFASIQKPKRITISLVRMQYRDDESLKALMTQFNEECIRIKDLIVFSAIMDLLRKIREEYFKRFLLKNKPKTMTELRLRVKKYINFDKAL